MYNFLDKKTPAHLWDWNSTHNYEVWRSGRYDVAYSYGTPIAIHHDGVLVAYSQNPAGVTTGKHLYKATGLTSVERAKNRSGQELSIPRFELLLDMLAADNAQDPHKIVRALAGLTIHQLQWLYALNHARWGAKRGISLVLLPFVRALADEELRYAADAVITAVDDALDNGMSVSDARRLVTYLTTNLAAA